MYSVLIVDDEPNIRKGLISFISWRELDCVVVGQACDGHEAVEKMGELNPDIVITDIRMPGLDGIELSKYLSENLPAAKVIILTGHADFAYAQAAIKYNVVDFVLKPTSTETICKAIYTAIEQINFHAENKKKVKELEDKIYLSQGEMRKKFLLEVVSRSLSEKQQIANKIESLDFCLSSFYMLALEIQNNEDSELAETVQRKSEFIQSIESFFSFSYKDQNYIITYINRNRLALLLYSVCSNPNIQLKNILNTCEDILSSLQGFMQFSLRIGISSLHSHAEHIPKAYEEASYALEISNYGESSINVYTNFIRKLSDEEKVLIHKNTMEIIESIQNGRYNNAISSLHQLFEKQKQLKHPLDYIRNTAILICSQLSGLLADYSLSLSDHSEDKGSVYKIIIECNHVPQILKILTDMMEMVSERIHENNGNNNQIISKALQFIKENYMNAISLQSVSDFIHVSSSYLSHLFKKETGDTLTEAIAKFRVEKAKELLKRNDIRTYEIASLTGIDNPAYFSFIFKKYTGFSPKEYKYKNIGK